MYSTCLFCNESLGRNATLEHFPIGRRIAFDTARGRLWAVCGKCKRWNLSPLDTRWEAIEDAERLYHDTVTRSSTDNIGLARVGDGVDLVRIGKPPRPEFAAWRYGPLFKRRYVGARTLAGLGLSAQITFGTGLASLLGVGASRVAGPLITLAYAAPMIMEMRSSLRHRWTVPTERSGVLRIRLGDVKHAQVVVAPHPDTAWQLLVRHRAPAGYGIRHSLSFGRLQSTYTKRTQLVGDEATHALRKIVTGANRDGGSAADVGLAVQHIESRLRKQVTDDDTAPLDASSMLDAGVHTLGRLHVHHRLALEMMLHESDERRALHGELAELEARWKEAEEIAGIADRLLVPAAVESRLHGLRHATERDTKRDTARVGDST